MFRNIIRISHPLNLLLAALTYMLGMSIPAYLGKPFLFLPFWLGLIYILLAQWSMSLFAEVFRPINEPIIENETLKSRESIRNNALYLSVGALTVNVVIAYILYVDNTLSFLTLSFGIFQIAQLRGIGNGKPPNWTFLISTALSVFGLTTYFLTLTFWLR